ncbi:hypothetical protein [Anaerocolumna chitinilytica]|uniref:Uncharacterized protein n=1 Tax=Anaerocolumna chitinilytica TaxID=1727145 RepID=A0A7I8DMH2_9FIRM|nr:hypothetical protein [Anaerocolumna chitinilytica]BCJ98917.1 hypothetical protein bsdcttw_19580 [Anaerocolumna chitinilytica]
MENKQMMELECYDTLNDERILNVTCTDNKEKMITLRNVHKNLLIDESRSQIDSKSDFFAMPENQLLKN